MAELDFNRINPSLLTAYESLEFFKRYGNEECREFVRKFKLSFSDSLITDSAASILRKAMDIYKEIRYTSAINLFSKLRDFTFFDIGCGITPRFLWMADNGRCYIGGDFPEVIKQIAPVYSEYFPPDFQDSVCFKEMDVTNNKSISVALKTVPSNVFISTEGLMMYLTETEFNTAVENIHNVLYEKKGYWICMDRIAKKLNLEILKILCSDNITQLKGYLESIQTIEKNTDKTVKLPKYQNALYLSDEKNVRSYFIKRGINYSSIPLANTVDRLNTTIGLPSEMQQKLSELLTKYSIDVFTCDPNLSPQKEYSSSNDYSSNFICSFSQLFIEIKGRLDTITSPECLETYEYIKRKNSDIQTVTINMLYLDYISSAGLRVLLTIYNDLKGKAKFRILNCNKIVREVFEKTGFSSIFDL